MFSIAAKMCISKRQKMLSMKEMILKTLSTNGTEFETKLDEIKGMVVFVVVISEVVIRM